MEGKSGMRQFTPHVKDIYDILYIISISHEHALQACSQQHFV